MAAYMAELEIGGIMSDRFVAHEGTFTVVLIPGVSMDHVPMSMRQGNGQVLVKDGRVEETADGIQCFGAPGGRWPFFFLKVSVVRVSDGSGATLWSAVAE